MIHRYPHLLPHYLVGLALAEALAIMLHGGKL